MSKNNSFTKAYQALNPEQRLAVDTLDGPLMVVAGPGTGKTQTIALRIANILKKTDTEPDAILALTFTESGARAMRERLVGLIGTPAYYVNISTFHSFCVGIIRDNPDFFTLDPSAEPLSELEKLKLIHKLLDSHKLKTIKPVGAPYHYTKAVLGSLSDLKREGVDPDEFAKVLAKEEEYLVSSGEELKKTEISKLRRDLAKNKDLLILFREYEEELASSHRFDFDDMINSVTKAFRADEDFLRSCQERFQYLLVDEYQDTNSAQNELLLLLASYWGDKANVMVTGDPDQSIYRFHGASIENQLSFIKVYPEAVVVTLKVNYRSTQTILDAADSLISHNNLRINDVVPSVDPHLTSTSGVGKPVNLASLSSNTAELVFLAEDIKAKIKNGASAEEIAIIYRTNLEAAPIADVLVRYGLDYSVQGGANVLEDPTVSNFIRILRVVEEMHRRQEDEDLFTILNYDLFKIAPLDVLKLARLAGSQKLTLFDVLAKPTLLDSLELETKPALLATFDLLAKFSALDANHTFSETFELILNDSGYLNWVLGQIDAHHRVSRINTLFDEVKKMNRSEHDLNLRGFLDNLDLIEENHLRLEESSYGKTKDAITLTTAHSAKGLEWDHVYLTRTVDGAWGNNKARELIHLPESLLTITKPSDKEKSEDERRLFYVALTRARKSVSLSYASEYVSFGSTRASIPSMFLSELGDTHTTKLDTTKIEKEAHLHLEKLLTKSSLPTTSKKEETFLAELVANFSLSVTALNTYLECPYKFKLDKLLKVPHSKKPHLAFGTAVHAAFESFYRSFKETSALPPKAFLISEFEKALDREVLTPKDHALRLTQGREILSSYYDFFVADFKKPLDLEKFSRVQLGDITLTGKLDRLETLDPAAHTVKVIDYKTGKGKSRNYIEGNTKDNSGDLKRQLVFYKLLIDLDRRLKNINFGEAELDFVGVPLEKGKSGRHSLSISAEEVDNLKKTIKEVMGDIRALKFPRTKDLKPCGNCDFRHHCYPNGLPSSS
ncbi:MAG: UvrD-helicase domain-containing protein [bacterium]